MSAYIDSAYRPFGRMSMCHMIADSREELDAMAQRIGVQRKWIQKAGTVYEHYDICMAKRKLAVAAGAIEITGKELVRRLHQRRADPGGMGTAPTEKAQD
jgi:Protein of unknown function (DUF4031)